MGAEQYATRRILLVGDRLLYLTALRDSLVHLGGIAAHLVWPGGAANGSGAAVDVVVADLPGSDTDVARRVASLGSMYPQAALAILHCGGDMRQVLQEGLVGVRVAWLDLRRPLVDIASEVRAGLPVGHPRSATTPDRGRYDPRSALSALTRREMEILDLLVGGHAPETIAERLGISKDTVRTHTANTMGKLQVTTQVQLLAYARRAGLRGARSTSGYR